MIAVFGLGPNAAPRPDRETDPCRADDKNGKAAATTALPLPLVGLPEQGLGQKREQLEERDAGVAFVEITPRRRLHRDAPDNLAQERLKAALVNGRRD